MNSEMDTDDARSSQEEGEAGTIVLDGSQLAAMRCLMHELSNVLTGVMISGGLLAQYLHPSKPAMAVQRGKALWQYAAGVCEGCERGGALLRELRGQLLAVCGEADAGPLLPQEAKGLAVDPGSSSGGQEPSVESF